MRVAGVLLAAGSATRFGSPKQLAELDGIPLVCHALENLLAVDALARVYVVVGAAGDRVAARCSPYEDVEVVRAPDWEEGMAASLRAGVAAADRAGFDAVLVHLADLPRVTPSVAEAVLAEPAPARAVFAGEPGHPVLIGRELFGEVAALTGDAGLRDVLVAAHTTQVEAGHLADPTDVDTPEALESLR